MTTTPSGEGWTPGPWEVEPADDGDRSVGLPGYNASVYAIPPSGSGLIADPVLICTIHAPTANPETPDPEVGGVPFGDECANARLIAASPDTYAVCRALVDFADQQFDGPNAPADMMARLTEIIEQARAALTLATQGAKAAGGGE